MTARRMMASSVRAGSAPLTRGSSLPSGTKKRLRRSKWHIRCHGTSVGREGRILGIVGASAPGDIVVEKFGFTLENVLTIAESLIQRQLRRESSPYHVFLRETRLSLVMT